MSGLSLHWCDTGGPSVLVHEANRLASRSGLVWNPWTLKGRWPGRCPGLG